MKFYDDSKTIDSIENEEKTRIIGIIFILCFITFIILIIELIVWNTNSVYKKKLEPIGYTTLVSITCIILYVIITSRNIELYESPNSIGRKFNLFTDVKSNLIIWVIFLFLTLLLVGDIWLGKERIKGIKFSIVPFFILIFVTITGLVFLRYILKYDLSPKRYGELPLSTKNKKLRIMEKEIYGNNTGLEDAIKEAQNEEIDEDKKREILEKAYLLNDEQKENFISEPKLSEKEIIYKKEYNVNDYFSLKEPDPELEWKDDNGDVNKKEYINILLKSGYKKN